jgi:hypothetical protein
LGKRGKWVPKFSVLGKRGKLSSSTLGQALLSGQYDLDIGLLPLVSGHLALTAGLKSPIFNIKMDYHEN